MGWLNYIHKTKWTKAQIKIDLRKLIHPEDKLLGDCIKTFVEQERQDYAKSADGEYAEEATKLPWSWILLEDDVLIKISICAKVRKSRVLSFVRTKFPNDLHNHDAVMYAALAELQTERLEVRDAIEVENVEKMQASIRKQRAKGGRNRHQITNELKERVHKKWKDWQLKPTLYKSNDDFADQMVSELNSDITHSTILKWCTLWKKNIGKNPLLVSRSAR